jgi:hypothetical protein
MAATHWLDMRLTMDNITWHFGNFGEVQLVAQTEAGLRELGLHELASCFADAKAIMLPLVSEFRENGGNGYDELLERAGVAEQASELDRRVQALEGDRDSGESMIYEAWLRYARQYPERVFGES